MRVAAPDSSAAPGAVAASFGPKLRDPLAGDLVEDVGRDGGASAVADHIRTPQPPNSVVSAPAGIRTSSVRLPSRTSRISLIATTVAFLSILMVFSPWFVSVSVTCYEFTLVMSNLSSKIKGYCMSHLQGHTYCIVTPLENIMVTP